MNNPNQELEWLAALRLGDEGALRAIFDRYYPRLTAVVAQVVSDADMARDLVQEVFVDLWNKRAEVEVHSSLGGYLRRAAVNRALNYLKSNRRFVFETLEKAPETTDSPEDVRERMADHERLEDALKEAIEALPERCRVVFSLSRFGQLSHREIADELGISVKTIENQITKAMKILRESLAQHPYLSPVVIWLLNMAG